MGCGESKLAVATTNTILRRKKSSVADPSKKSKDIETVLENNDSAANSSVQHQQQHDQQEEQVKEDNAIANNVGGGGEASAVADDVNVNVKDIKVNNKGGEDGGKEVLEKGDKEEHDEAAGRLISHGSPNRFFSSRKLDEEGIDAIISEGRSGTSDYYTPRHGSKGNLHFKVDDDIAEDDNELHLPAAETKTPAVETQNKGTEEPVKKPEENSVKETEVAVTTTVEAEVAEAAEPEVSIPAEEVKN
ncbi:uncharacterized protein LOC103943710 [Pyrus x bretschneideri]|uniref:uncharacterized protein LOC103943710 n=1 Tax=Pyrus x bretschneideri TaxID=225117 RepID=UPI002030478E|nr:uncharacterized protein LOC103943710 [Pyrus x bretschneideri]